MKLPSLSNRKVPLALGAAVLALLLAGVFSYRSMVVAGASVRWVQHTHLVLDDLQDLLLGMVTVESSFRGFVLTGKNSYLDAYHAAIAIVEHDERAARSLTGDNPVQRRHLSELENLTTQKIQFGDRIIAIRQTAGREAAANAIESGSGQQSKDGFQEVIRSMQREELRLLAERDSESRQRFLRFRNSLVLGGSAFGFVIVALAGWILQSYYAARGRTEAAFLEGEERFRLLVEGVQDYAIFRLDPQGNVMSWNAGAERIKGYQAEEIIGQNCSRFYLEKDVNQGRPQEALQVAAAAGRFETEHWRVRKDGSKFFANTIITAARSSSGNLLGFSEISRDITERKENEARYRGLLEAAPDAMVVVDQQGEIVLLNFQAEKQFQYRRDQLVGRQVKVIIPEGFAERLIADSNRTAADALAQQIGTGIELYGRRKDGSEFPIEIMLSPLESTEGILVTAAIRNIAERKNSEAHLLKTMTELKRSNDELQQFAYIASHDLQEPLRMVASYTQLLAKRYGGRLDADADEFIAFAVDGCNRMQRLIQDLLAYSRAGTRGEAVCETSGESALDQALANLRATIRDSGAVITHDLLPAVTTDGTQLAQVFQNLVANAIKYRSAAVPHVHVSAANHDSEWIFSVRDNGIGIDSRYFERIFVLFQRLHRHEEFEGTGIGLAICKKTLERLGGRIWVESQPGQGSTFLFALPNIGGNR
jgi:PAS domain S-box-containing protein